MNANRQRRGPKPSVLKVDLPIAEGLRRLVKAPPITPAGSRYAKGRKPKRTA